MDPVAFLLARLDEDEAAVKGPRAYQWHTTTCSVSDYEHDIECYCDVPARVLREVKAKRRIIAECSANLDEAMITSGAQLAEAALSALASAYSDHPDYDPKWAV